MSKIDELIKEKCPNGVERKPLREIAKIKRGERITKKDITDDGEYPVMSGGVKSMGRYKDKNRDANTITISSYGAAGFVNYVEEDFWANDVCLSVYPNEKILINRYLYFALKAQQQYIYDNTTKAIPDHIPTKFLEDLQIPVPPLEIQQEIVGMLNSFTELEAELEAELTKRKQQYEHYRDHLLSFENIAGEGGQVEWLTLDELCSISAGGDVPKDALSDTKTNEYPIPIISNGIRNNAVYGYTTNAKITKPAVTVSARGTIGYAEYRDYPYYPIVRLLSVIPNDSEKLNAKYLYYCLQCKKYKLPTSGIPQLTAPDLKKQKVPVPSKKIQERIVYVLDNFDAVCSDLNIGLPAEIEARQKQYEYYRDRLLSFDAVIGDGTERERERGVAKLRQYIFGYYIAKIEDLCDISRGIVMSKDFIKDNAGDYPVYSSQTENDGILGKINTYKYDGEYLTWTTDGANAGTVFRRSGKFSVTNVCGLLKIKEEDILNDYLYYALSVEAKKHVNSGMGNPKLMSNVMGSIKVIVPSAEQQESIIKVLNNLSEICESFKSGLPAEIGARHKQYEYYRDKLLTFSEK